MAAENEHKSVHESINENQGNEINENHNVETEESGEVHKTKDEEDNNSSFHEDGAEGIYASKSINKDSEQKRSFEKGMYI